MSAGASAAHGASTRRRVNGMRVEGRERYKVMTLAANEFIRRFLIHVLPDAFLQARGAARQGRHFVRWLLAACRFRHVDRSSWCVAV
jgi:hypothetical protein